MTSLTILGNDLPKMLTLEVFCDFFIPKGDIALAIVDYGPEFGVPTEVRHKVSHTVDALNEVHNAFLGGLFVEGARRVLDGFAEDRWEAGLHSSMGE